jgi:hypothetical protein
MSIYSLRSRQSNRDPSLDYNGLNDSEAPETSSAITHSRQPDMEWVFNKGLKLVLHDVNCCRTCEDFAVHNSNATIRSPTYRTACSARKLAITGDVQGRIDRRQSQLEATKKKALRLQQQLIGLHKSLNTSRNELRMSLGRLEDVRRYLKEARQDRVAAGDSYNLIFKLSQCSRSS